MLDTDVLIDAGRGITEAIDCLEQHRQKSTLGISVVTQLELIVGCRDKREQQKLSRFLRHFDVKHLDESASKTAVALLTRYRLSHGLLIPAALIAATALAGDFPLLTKNQRDYRFIDGLNLLPYP